MENSQENQVVENDCITRPYPYTVDEPIIDSLNIKSFFPDAGGILYLRGQYQSEKMFALDLGIQPEFGKGNVMAIAPYTNLTEQLKFLKELNRITFEAIKFIERNNLKQRT